MNSQAAVKTDKSGYTTARIWVKTLRTLRLIAALTNESMVKVMDRLAKQELERLKEQGKTW